MVTCHGLMLYVLRVKPACTGVEEDHGLVYIESVDAMIEAY